jgi:hypothetical protein
MKIFSWSNPAYFHFLVALVRSIRYHGNAHEIILHLMDFTPEDKDMAARTFERDSKVSFIYSSSKNQPYTVNNRFEYYRNCRPRYFLQILEQYGEHLLTFGANGIIRRKLDFIEELLEEKDFLFLERPSQFAKVLYHNVRELHEAVKSGKVKATPKTYGQMVLLGTHAIANRPRTLEVIRLWRDTIEKKGGINEFKWDMGLFAQSMVLIEDEYREPFLIETGASVPRNEHPFCDTSFSKDSNIWFAKSQDKWNNKTYLQAVEFFTNYEYEL